MALGDQVNLRDVAARVLPAWPEGMLGAGFVAGMYAFGLEECGDYRAAERYGRAALAANARDAWAAHAILHVFEMEGRQADGLAFVAETARDWGSSYFAVHNWWHSGLYYLELGQLRHALAIYDDCVAAQGQATPLGRADATSLLWRLWLHGADIGGRAGALAGAFEMTLSDSAYCFHDWHAVMALALAGRLGAAYGLAAELAARATGTNKIMLQRAGLDVMLGVIAFARRQYPSAVELLGQARRHVSPSAAVTPSVTRSISRCWPRRRLATRPQATAPPRTMATAPWSERWSLSGWPASRPAGARPSWSSRPARPGSRGTTLASTALTSTAPPRTAAGSTGPFHPSDPRPVSHVPPLI